MVNPERRKPTPVNCDVCGTIISRKADLARHKKIHAPNKDDLMFKCSHPDCSYKTLQRSNLQTHLNTHENKRPNKCPTAGCDFASGDPGALTKHRQGHHAYVAKANSRKKVQEPSTGAHRPVRPRLRVSPYTSSSSTSPGSTASPLSSLGQSPDCYHTPLLEPIAEPCVEGPADDGTECDYRAATKPLEFGDLQLASNTERETRRLTTGLLMAHEGFTTQEPQSQGSIQENAYAMAQPYPEISDEVTHEVCDNFDESQTDISPVDDTTSLSATFGDIAQEYLPQNVDGYQYQSVDPGAAGPSTTQNFDAYHYSLHNDVSSYAGDYAYTTANAPSYVEHGHSSHSISFDPYTMSHSYSVAASNVGFSYQSGSGEQHHTYTPAGPSCYEGHYPL